MIPFSIISPLFSADLRCLTSLEPAFAGLAVMTHKVNPKDRSPVPSLELFFHSEIATEATAVGDTTKEKKIMAG